MSKEINIVVQGEEKNLTGTINNKHSKTENCITKYGFILSRERTETYKDSEQNRALD